MTLGIIARCDTRGGLAAITREVWRHLTPERTLLLALPDSGRGDCIPSAFDLHASTYQQVYPATFHGSLPDRAVEWITDEGIDTIWSAETFYSDDKVLPRAHRNAIRSICYAMPELAPWAATPNMRVRPRTLHIPTAYRAETLPDAELLPMPVARDRLPFHARDALSHIYHPTGAAFHDRNGTNIFLRALQFVESQLRVTIRSEKPVDIPRTRCDVEIIDTATENYWDQYDPTVDLLVLPRRFGGLCLPLQECASLGVPTLALDIDPYAPYGFVHSIPTTGATSYPMKGNPRGIPVHDADPRVLAAKIDWLVAHPDRQHAASHAADAWAEAHAWHGPLGDRWCSALSANCSERQQAA